MYGPIEHTSSGPSAFSISPSSSSSTQAGLLWWWPGLVLMDWYTLPSSRLLPRFQCYIQGTLPPSVPSLLFILLVQLTAHSRGRRRRKGASLRRTYSPYTLLIKGHYCRHIIQTRIQRAQKIFFFNFLYSGSIKKYAEGTAKHNYSNQHDLMKHACVLRKNK